MRVKISPKHAVDVVESQSRAQSLVGVGMRREIVQSF